MGFHKLFFGIENYSFKLYLESKFEPWMSWDNYGKYNGKLCYGWDIDHIVPLSSANTEEEIIKLSHYTNLQPLCSKINRYYKPYNKIITMCDILLSVETISQINYPMDDWSTKFTNDLNREERQLREKIKEDQKYSSGCPDKHPDYPQLNSLSEALIGLMTNPTWLDIHFVQDKLGRFQLEIDEFGDFEKLKTKSIEAIVNHFNI
jgi:hypothetical protein